VSYCLYFVFALNDCSSHLLSHKLQVTSDNASLSVKFEIRNKMLIITEKRYELDM